MPKCPHPLQTQKTISLDDLKKEVLLLTSETSEKYIPSPKHKDILCDLLIGLKKFRNTVRSKEFFINMKSTNNHINSNINVNDSTHPTNNNAIKENIDPKTNKINTSSSIKQVKSGSSSSQHITAGVF